ncbi:MAG: PAS domain-containing protein [Salinivirgaceae bacterium]|jgi:PAS domain S-box-containing protein|nr:PAS domain-containing protein [Salinivirgaceae bacterium]
MDKKSKHPIIGQISVDVLFNESIEPQGVISIDRKESDVFFYVSVSNKSFNKIANIKEIHDPIPAHEIFSFLEGFNCKPLTQLVLSGNTKDLEFIYTSKDITYKLALKKYSNNSILFTLHNITSLQLVRAELNEKKRQLKESQEIASLGYWVENHKSKKHFWSDQIFKILNIESNSIKPSFNSYLEFVYEKDRSKVEEEFKSALKNKLGYEITHRLRLKNGTIKHVILRSYTNYSQSELPQQSIGIIQDITTSEIIKHELKNSEAIFRSVFDFAPIAIVLVNDQYSPVFCNNQFSELVGYSIEQIYKHGLKDFTHVDDYENNLLQYQRLFKGEVDSFSLTKRYVRKCGRILWAKVIVSSINGSKGKGKMAIAMVQDISAEKEATEALVKSEYQYRTLIDNASDGIGLFDYDFKPIVYNDILYKMLGYSHTEYLEFDHNKYELFHPEDVLAAHEALTSLRNGERALIENRMRNKDGTYSFFSISYIPVKHEGKPAILIFRRNISKRKIAEQQNEEYRLFLETLMDNLPVSLFAKTTPDFRYLYWNSTIERVTGIPAEDAIGKNDYELMQFRQLADQYFDEDQKLLKSRRKLESEHEFTNSIGEVKQFKTIKTLHQSNTGNPLILGISVDITKLKEAEKLVEQSTQMLKQAQKIAKLGYWEYDVKKDLFFDNLENRQILGTETLSYFINYKQFIELLHESDRDRVKQAFKKCINNKTPGEGLIKVLVSSKIKHIAIKYTPIEDDKGKVIKLRGTCLDITRIRKSEMALRESESRLKQAEHIAKVGYWDYDFVKEKTKFSDEILNILEVYDRNSKLGLNEFFESVHDDDRIKVTSQFQKSKTSNQPFDIVFKIVTYNNNLKVIKAIGTFVKNQDGGIARSIGTIQDITDIKKNEIELEKSAKQLKDIQRASKIGFIEQFVNSQQVKFSETLVKILEFDDSIELRDIDDYNILIHPHDKMTILKTIEKSLNNKQSYNLQYRLILKSGRTMYVNEICSIDINKPKAVITRIIQDVTALKEQKIVLDKVSEAQETTLLGNWEYNLATNHYKFNKGLKDLYHIQKADDEITNADFLQLIHADDRHDVEKAISDAGKVVESFTLNYRIKLANGQEKYVQNFGNFYKNALDEEVIYGVVRDVSDYRNILNTLNDKTELFKAITENSLLGIVIYQNGQRVFANDKWAEMVGVDKEQLNSGLELNQIFKSESTELINVLFSQWHEFNLTEYTNKITLKPLNSPEFVIEIFAKQIQYLNKEAMLIIALPSQNN